MRLLTVTVVFHVVFHLSDLAEGTQREFVPISGGEVQRSAARNVLVVWVGSSLQQ